MKLKKNRAFTLIELLVSLSIISIISMAFFSFLNSSIKINSKNEKDINSLNIAQSEIEKLRKQIKSVDGDTDISIQVSENEYIFISNIGDKNIKWIKESNDKSIEYIRILDSGKYAKYIGYEDDGVMNNSIIKYIISKNEANYLVNLIIKREKIGSKYLYKIKVRVNNENFKFSNKSTILYTEILSK